MSARECVSAARGYVLAASLVAEAAARHAIAMGDRDLSYRHQGLAVSCAKLGADLSARLQSRESSPDDLRAAMDAICIAGEAVQACQESMGGDPEEATIG